MYQPYPGSETQLPETQLRPAPASVNTAVIFLWRRDSGAYFRAPAA
jgi:hypothetical protein